MKPLTLMLLLLASPLLLADGHGNARRLREAGDVLPLSRIIQQLPAAARQRVIEADLKQQAGRPVYEIEALDGKGRVWEYRFDAQSGQLLERKGDD